MVAVVLSCGGWLLVLGELVSAGLLYVLGCRVARAVVSWEEVERKEEEIFRRAKVYLCPGLRLTICPENRNDRRESVFCGHVYFLRAAVWLVWLGW